MTNKKMFAFLVIVLVGLSCRTTDTIVSLRTTATTLPTRTVKPTYTSTPLPTATLLSTVTGSPTSTPSKTLTLKAVPSRTRTPIPAKTTAALATSQPSPYSFRVDSIYCLHSGGAFGNGFVLENADHRSGIDGLKVRMSTDPGGPPAAPDATTENKYMMNEYYSEGGLEGGFSHIINANGPANGETRYFWIVDGNGNALSDPGKAKVTYSNRPDNHACWESIVTFIKN